MSGPVCNPESSPVYRGSPKSINQSLNSLAIILFFFIMFIGHGLKFGPSQTFSLAWVVASLPIKTRGFLEKLDKVFCALTVWETERDRWETDKRMLREFWKTAERQLRDCWETAERLSGPRWKFPSCFFFYTSFTRPLHRSTEEF